MALKCTTCGVSLEGQDCFVKFKCPNCQKAEIIRCNQCKKLSTPFKCSCGFEGP